MIMMRGDYDRPVVAKRPAKICCRSDGKLYVECWVDLAVNHALGSFRQSLHCQERRLNLR